LKKAVIIFGSPRKDGNTRILVEECLKGLADSGIESNIIFLNEKRIKPCQACYHCKQIAIGECKINDDMQAIYQTMEEADGIVVATPIYWAYVTSQTKIWLDRLFPYLNKKSQATLFKGKIASYLFTQNQPDPDMFLRGIKTFQIALTMLGFKNKDTLIAYDLDMGYKPMANENPDFMERAYLLGRELLG
jgi:multimeric flavodoxin WrbA